MPFSLLPVSSYASGSSPCVSLRFTFPFVVPLPPFTLPLPPSLPPAILSFPVSDLLSHLTYEVLTLNILSLLHPPLPLCGFCLPLTIFSFPLSASLQDEPNRQAFERLEKKCRELFGRVTASVTDNAEIWKAYAGLYLDLQPTSGDDDNDDHRVLKGVQFLQRSLRCLTQKSGWDLEVGSVEETLKKSNAIVRRILDADDDEGSGGGGGKVTVASLSSLKMVVRTTVVKMEKKYGVTAPSEAAESEMVTMKGHLVTIEEKINAKKAMA